jgi:hypothetical protein
MTEDKQKIAVSFGHGANVANIQIGNQNQMSLLAQQIEFSAPETINIGMQVSELRKILENLKPDTDINTDIQIVEQEISLPNPDKNKIGYRIKSIMQYLSEKSMDIVVTKSLEHIFIAICSWLGSDWHSLMQSTLFHLPN